MSTPVVFRQAARTEFDEAADWYELRQAGLGAAFIVQVQQILDKIAAQPSFYPRVTPRGVREALVSGFPYCVYYRDEPDRVVVISVFHTARNPAISEAEVLAKRIPIGEIFAATCPMNLRECGDLRLGH